MLNNMAIRGTYTYYSSSLDYGSISVMFYILSTGPYEVRK